MMWIKQQQQRLTATATTKGADYSRTNQPAATRNENETLPRFSLFSIVINPPPPGDMNQMKKNRRRQQQQQLHRRRRRQKPSRQPARIVIPVPLVRTAAMTLLLALSMSVLLSSRIETTTATRTTTTTSSSSSSSTAVLAFACSRIRPTGRAPRGIVATNAATAAATAATRRGRGASFLPATREGRPPPVSDDGDGNGNGNEGSSSSSRIRRDVLQSIVPTAFFAASSAAAAAPTAAAATAAPTTQPLVDVAMVRLKLPGGGLGEDYVAMPVYVNGHGPYEFMLDTGLTAEFVTPRLVRRERLADGDQAGATPIRGLAAGGTPAGQTLIELKDVVALPSSKDGMRSVPLSTLHAVITDFPQEHIDPKHDPVEGMVGMELLSRYDVDLDFQHQRIRLYPPGTVIDSILQDQSDRNKYVVVPAVVINETGLIGIRLNVPGRQQPVLAFLDCGSSFTCLNWEAAHYLGFPAEQDSKAYADQPRIAAIGIDGRPIVLPTYPQSFTYSGDAVASPTDPKRLVGFEAPPPAWEPWKSVQVAIGDIPAFRTVLGDGITPYRGPAALVGLDVLTQKRRFVLEGTSPNNPTRKRRILISTT